MPPPRCKLNFELLTLRGVSKSRVTCATSVPILVFIGLSVLDLDPVNETERRQTRIIATHGAGAGLVFTARRYELSQSLMLVGVCPFVCLSDTFAYCIPRLLYR